MALEFIVPIRYKYVIYMYTPYIYILIFYIFCTYIIIYIYDKPGDGGWARSSVDVGNVSWVASFSSVYRNIEELEENNNRRFREG